MLQFQSTISKWHFLAALGSGVITGYAGLLGLFFAMR